MNNYIFTVYDQKARAYLPPFFLPEIGMAQRVFGDCCNDAEHQFGKHPSDYTLFQLGTFDNTTGFITCDNAPLSLGSGVEYIKKEIDEDALEVLHHQLNEVAN